MSIPENNPQKSKRQSADEKYLGSYVLTESEIRDFIENLRIADSHILAERLLVVFHAAGAIAEGADKQLNMKLIRQIASEDRTKGYQRLMKAIIAAIEAGEDRIAAAQLTITLAMEYAFEMGPAMNAAEKMYKARLKRLR